MKELARGYRLLSVRELQLPIYLTEKIIISHPFAIINASCGDSFLGLTFLKESMASPSLTRSQ